MLQFNNGTWSNKLYFQQKLIELTYNFITVVTTTTTTSTNMHKKRENSGNRRSMDYYYKSICFPSVVMSVLTTWQVFNCLAASILLHGQLHNL